MTFRCVTFILVASAVLAAPATADAQSQAQIYATVISDSQDTAPVVGLVAADVVLRDGGQKQSVLAVELAPAPLAIAVVVSGFSAADRSDIARAIAGLLPVIRAGNAASEIRLVTGGETGASHLTTLTTDLSGLNAILDALLKTERGWIPDAVDACDALRDAPTDRRVVLAIIRRGARKPSPNDLTEELTRTRTALWTVEVGSAASDAAFDGLLNDVMQLSGSLRTLVPTISVAADGVSRVARFLLAQQLVTFMWPDPMLSTFSIATRHDAGAVLTPAWFR